MEIHSCFWENNDPIFYEYHKKIMNKFDINVQYHKKTINPGEWMNNVINNCKEEVLGFIDIDCVITNKKIINECQNYIIKCKSIIGIAQVSNHIKPQNHIFVGPGFFFINVDTWKKLGRPSFKARKNKLKNFFRKKFDVAEGVCYKFEKYNIKYKAFYPSFYQLEADNYNLHNYGKYGIGTYYEEGIYHLFESRKPNNINCFKKKCIDILNNKFSTADMYNCKKI
jgi:hypothetical protein